MIKTFENYADPTRRLIQAIGHYDEPMFRDAIKNGADINTVDGRGDSLLMQAYILGYFDMAINLIKNGADLFIYNKFGDDLYILMKRNKYKENSKIREAIKKVNPDYIYDRETRKTANKYNL